MQIEGKIIKVFAFHIEVRVSYGRKIYLINPSFQIKFSIFVCALLILVSTIYPFTILELMNGIINHLESMLPNVATDFRERKSKLIMFLILMQLGFTGLTFFICVFFSHKIAGPIYKLQMHLRGIREGKIRNQLYFRKGDYFQELASDVNLTLDHIEENIKKDIVYISEVQAYIQNLIHVVPDDKQSVLKEIHEKLGEIQNRYNERAN